MLRWVTVSLLLLAAGAGAAGLLPAREARDRARVDFAHARQERERLRAEIAALERGIRVDQAPEDPAAAARALRRSFLSATAGLPLAEVRISTSNPGGSGRAGARGTLGAEGRLADLLRVADRLIDPSLGVRVQRVTLAAASGDDDGTATTIEIECQGEGVAP